MVTKVKKENYSVTNSFKNIVSTKKFGREAAKKHVERINGYNNSLIRSPIVGSKAVKKLKEKTKR